MARVSAEFLMQSRKNLMLCAVLAALLASSLAHAEGDSRPVECMCSMVSVIANPEAYDGKRIRTMGVAEIEFEGTAIYLSSESAEKSVLVNGIGLAVEATDELKKLVHRKWVIVEGIYHKWEMGETGWRGSISDISLLYAPEDVKEVE